MKRIGILGSTGSIGTQALELIDKNDQFKVSYLSAFSNVDLLIQQVKKFNPKAVCIVNDSKLSRLQDGLKGFDIEILSGHKGLEDLASRSNMDLLLNAVPQPHILFL